MSVRFKFKNDKDYVTLPCDGFNISVRDLKRSIIRAKKLGRVTDFDLTVTNATTSETYDDEEELIPKNSSLVVMRHPLPSGQKKVWEEESVALAATATSMAANGGAGGSVASIVSAIGNEGHSEEDKLSKMMSNSTEMYDQKNWVLYRGKMAAGGKPPPKMFRCSKCHQTGHWPQDCSLSELKKTTGIPRSFLKPTTAETPGAKINPQGIKTVAWVRCIFLGVAFEPTR
jgi:hypothetical protein